MNYPEYKLNKCARKRTHWKIYPIDCVHLWIAICTRCKQSHTGQMYRMSYPGAGELYCKECLDTMIEVIYKPWVGAARAWNYALYCLFRSISPDVAMTLGPYMKHIPKLIFIE